VGDAGSGAGASSDSACGPLATLCEHTGGTCVVVRCPAELQFQVRALRVGRRAATACGCSLWLQLVFASITVRVWVRGMRRRRAGGGGGGGNDTFAARYTMVVVVVVCTRKLQMGTAPPPTPNLSLRNSWTASLRCNVGPWCG
jgi:hypothetical protein